MPTIARRPAAHERQRLQARRLRAVYAAGMLAGLESDLGPHWGPRTTGELRTTVASDGQPAAQISSRFRAFSQVV